MRAARHKQSPIVTRSALAAIAGGGILLGFGACGGPTTTMVSSLPAPTPTPTGGHRIQQLKTPLIPPAPVSELASYPLLSIGSGFNYLPGIVWGPDSNVWVSEWTADKIARVTPTGTVTEYPLPTSNAVPADMTVGPDGKVWFSETSADAIANIDVSTFVITEHPLDPSIFPVVTGEGPRGIITGPDGNLWFESPDSDLLAKMSPDGVVLNVYHVPTHDAANVRLAVGPDGNIWFTESEGNKIGKLEIASGGITEFNVPTAASYPYGIVTASDGNLWFTERDASQVGRITTAGVITEYQTPSAIASPSYMTTTLDGSIWFPEDLHFGLCRVDPIHLTEVEYLAPGPPSGSLFEGITAGEGSTTTWITNEQTNNSVVEFGPGSGARPRRISSGHLRPVHIPRGGFFPPVPIEPK